MLACFLARVFSNTERSVNGESITHIICIYWALFVISYSLKKLVFYCLSMLTYNLSHIVNRCFTYYYIASGVPIVRPEETYLI